VKKIILLMIILSAILCGCTISISPASSEDPDADNKELASPDEDFFKLNYGDAIVLSWEETDTLTVGDIAYILKEETPSTGYLWYYEVMPEGVVAIVSDERHQYNDSDMPGGDRSWRALEVKALAPGKAVITMTQKCGDEISQSFTYEILVIGRNDQASPPPEGVMEDGFYTGVLLEGRFYHDGHGEWIGYYYADVGRAQFDKLNNELGGVYDLGQKVETEIQLYATDESIRLGDYIGQKITFKGEFFEGNTIYHRRNIVFEIKELTGAEAPAPPLEPNPYAYLVGAWVSERLAGGARNVILFESGNEARLLLCYPRDYEVSGEDLSGWKTGSWAIDSECSGTYEIADGNLDFMWDSDWYNPGYTIVKHSDEEIDLVGRDYGEATRYTRLPD